MMRTELIASVPQLLRRQAQKHPDKVAFDDANSSITYKALEASTGRLAGNLQALGVAPGDRVAVFLPNSVQWVESSFAITRAGAIGVPISYDSAPPEISYRLTDAACRVLITTDEQYEQIARLLPGAKCVEQVILVDRGAAKGKGLRYTDLRTREPAAPARDPDDIDGTSYIIYTSGTTGRAKGVLLSVRSMLWVSASCWAPIAGLSENDRVLSPLPLFHSYALNLCVLGILATGASETILERYSTQGVTDALATGSYTVMPGVPTMFHYLMEGAKAQKTNTMPGMRLCISAGAILTAQINTAFEETFHIPLLDGYGITETATMVTMNWPTGARVMGSCGLPLPGLAVRIVDPASGRDVALGAEGELIVRGPNLMSGYHNKPEETAKALRDGWYYTGDLAKSDLNGYLTITGRVKELIIRGGQNIAPAEVEIAVNTHPAVLDCAVVGGKHEMLGEVPVVFVVLRPGMKLEAEALIAHCRTQLSAYKVPAAVHFTDAIPRTGSGKTIRYKLRDLL